MPMLDACQLRAAVQSDEERDTRHPRRFRPFNPPTPVVARLIVCRDDAHASAREPLRDESTFLLAIIQPS